MWRGVEGFKGAEYFHKSLYIYERDRYRKVAYTQSIFTFLIFSGSGPVIKYLLINSAIVLHKGLRSDLGPRASETRVGRELVHICRKRVTSDSLNPAPPGSRSQWLLTLSSLNAAAPTACTLHLVQCSNSRCRHLVVVTTLSPEGAGIAVAVESPTTRLALFQAFRISLWGIKAWTTFLVRSSSVWKSFTSWRPCVIEIWTDSCVIPRPHPCARSTGGHLPYSR